ncbi:hypothetical protein CEXT_181351 [Caerostris extrusa]|uniref:Uncharacterized protein n=1 Tax=Caerostris extrusa TaxID=172846 RepID=A0AAV4T8W4_CAEEX|nr:hypothetical protein CEXT_181351 [Caerostris extrusa]
MEPVLTTFQGAPSCILGPGLPVPKALPPLFPHDNLFCGDQSPASARSKMGISFVIVVVLLPKKDFF